MSRVQVIEKDGKPDFYVVPADIWERVREMVEDAEDAAAYAEAVANDDGVRYPAAVAHAIADGASALKAWREHRGLTLQALADAAGVSKAYASQIESGKRTGSAATLKKLADALGVRVEALLRLHIEAPAG
jgi:DNA-binding XRE family transcriptional regulator